VQVQKKKCLKEEIIHVINGIRSYGRERRLAQTLISGVCDFQKGLLAGENWASRARKQASELDEP